MAVLSVGGSTVEMLLSSLVNSASTSNSVSPAGMPSYTHTAPGRNTAGRRRLQRLPRHKPKPILSKNMLKPYQVGITSVRPSRRAHSMTLISGLVILKRSIIKLCADHLGAWKQILLVADFCGDLHLPDPILKNTLPSLVIVT